MTTKTFLRYTPRWAGWTVWLLEMALVTALTYGLIVAMTQLAGCAWYKTEWRKDGECLKRCEAVDRDALGMTEPNGKRCICYFSTATFPPKLR